MMKGSMWQSKYLLLCFLKKGELMLLARQGLATSSRKEECCRWKGGSRDIQIGLEKHAWKRSWEMEGIGGLAFYLPTGRRAARANSVLENSAFFFVLFHIIFMPVEAISWSSLFSTVKFLLGLLTEALLPSFTIKFSYPDASFLE